MTITETSPPKLSQEQRPEWMESPIYSLDYDVPRLSNSLACGLFNILEHDEFWTEIEVVERQLHVEKVEHVRGEAISDAIYRMGIDKETKFMTPEVRAMWLAKVVANQCLGIKPVFGKGN